MARQASYMEINNHIVHAATAMLPFWEQGMYPSYARPAGAPHSTRKPCIGFSGTRGEGVAEAIRKCY